MSQDYSNYQTWQTFELDTEQLLHPLPDEEARSVGDFLLAAGQGVAAAARLGGDVGGHGGVQLQPLPEPRVAVAAVTAGTEPGRLNCIITMVEATISSCWPAVQCWFWTHVMKFNDDYSVESAGKKEEESMQSEVMLGKLHNFCIFFQIGPNAQYKRTR